MKYFKHIFIRIGTVPFYFEYFKCEIKQLHYNKFYHFMANFLKSNFLKNNNSAISMKLDACSFILIAILYCSQYNKKNHNINNNNLPLLWRNQWNTLNMSLYELELFHITLNILKVEWNSFTMTYSVILVKSKFS